MEVSVVSIALYGFVFTIVPAHLCSAAVLNVWSRYATIVLIAILNDWLLERHKKERKKKMTLKLCVIELQIRGLNH